MKDSLYSLIKIYIPIVLFCVGTVFTVKAIIKKDLDTLIKGVFLILISLLPLIFSIITVFALN